MVSLSFLDLPFKARLRIYSYLDLVRPCPIDLTPGQISSLPPNPTRHAIGTSSDDCFYRMRERGALVLGRRTRDCYCSRPFMELLLVSKDIYREVFGLFYSRNKFVFRGHTEADLAPLSIMSVKAIGAMTSLLIRLNCWPCPKGHEGHPSDEAEGGCAVCFAPATDADPVLDSASKTGQSLVQQWKLTCNHLSSAISPGRLRLTFICDVANLDSGEKVIEPLVALPLLKQCTIRFGRQRNANLRNLAERSCRKLTNDYVSHSGFPYSQLPQELRLQILNYTHLGTEGCYLDQFSQLCIEDSKLIKKYERSHNSRSTCCSKCSETFADCCCSTMHGSYAKSCECRELPFALFLVNKQMYCDALEVFYTKASFEFAEIPTEILCFFNRLPLEGLKFVRQLLFRVQPKQFFRWNQDNYLRKWQSLADFIKINFNIPNLSIIIDSEEMYDHCIWAEQEEDNRFYYDISSQIADTMCILRGIRDIHFRLAWFTPMGPIFERRVIGNSYIDKHPQVKPLSPLYEMEWRIPSWHNTNLPAS